VRGWLLLLLVLAGVWLWRSRPASLGQRPTPPQSPPTLDTVACSLCAVHIPRAEAVQGKRGSYCCPEHLRQAEP